MTTTMYVGLGIGLFILLALGIIRKFLTSIAIETVRSYYKVQALEKRLYDLAFDHAELTKEADSWKQQALARQQMYMSMEHRMEDAKKLHQAQLLRINAEFQNTLMEQEKTVREDANKRSRAVMRGQATEHLAPIMQTEWNFKDFRFMGDPIDYLVVDGSSGIKDGELNIVTEVVLLDIKTGKSQLNKTQRRIRDAVVEGRVVFAVYNTDTETIRRWPKGEEDGTDS
jgi:predicted Holliday junction resolvase-like endonuclease